MDGRKRWKERRGKGVKRCTGVGKQSNGCRGSGSGRVASERGGQVRGGIENWEKNMVKIIR